MVKGNEVYFIELRGNSGKKSVPCYTCGHCTSVVLMDPLRTRERTSCRRCGRWICESSELCNLDCTPMYALADNYFEDEDRWGFSRAILAGENTIEGAVRRNLIDPSKL